IACKNCVKKGVACGPKVGGQKWRVVGNDNEPNRAQQITAGFKDHMADHEVEEIIHQPIYPEEEVPEPLDSHWLDLFFRRDLNYFTDCPYEGFGVKRFLIQRFGCNLPKAIQYAVILSARTDYGILSARTDYGIRLASAQTSR